MERVNRIIQHEVFIKEMKKLNRLERDRMYCRHDIDHLLNVARLAYITALEETLPLKKDLIYAAALLHDIGRASQYETGMPHDKAGALIAETVLTDCGFGEGECAEILEAISCHRSKDTAAGDRPLARILYEADKRSRACFACKAQDSCNWPIERKNYNVKR
ncbi:MAG: HD domain-containing protein [Lachnospiraceae bacterium]|nr:HD domain-containing protein [Lachnospiraceae bacterium]